MSQPHYVKFIENLEDEELFELIIYKHEKYEVEVLNFAKAHYKSRNISSEQESLFSKEIEVEIEQNSIQKASEELRNEQKWNQFKTWLVKEGKFADYFILVVCVFMLISTIESLYFFRYLTKLNIEVIQLVLLNLIEPIIYSLTLILLWKRHKVGWYLAAIFFFRAIIFPISGIFHVIFSDFYAGQRESILIDSISNLFSFWNLFNACAFILLLTKNVANSFKLSKKRLTYLFISIGALVLLVVTASIVDIFF